jgi:hypothetical protein
LYTGQPKAALFFYGSDPYQLLKDLNPSFGLALHDTFASNKYYHENNYTQSTSTILQMVVVGLATSHAVHTASRCAGLSVSTRSKWRGKRGYDQPR